MSSGHIVCIETRPYIKDYFINTHGGSEPIKVTTSNNLFRLLSRHLTQKPKYWKLPVVSKDILMFELPNNDELNVMGYNYIPPSSYSPINSYLYGLFYCQFIEYMNENVIKKRWQVKYAVYNFLDMHYIDSENYDALFKIYYRYRHQDIKKLEDDDSK